MWSLKVKFMYKISKTDFNGKNICPTKPLELWNNFLLILTLNTTQITKIEGVVRENVWDCKRPKLKWTKTNVSMTKYFSNWPFGALKQLFPNIHNGDSKNNQNCATPSFWNCDRKKLIFYSKLAKMNFSMVKYLFNGSFGALK